MLDDPESQAIILFVQLAGENGLRSTGAQLTDCHDILYPVTGSTRDPKNVPGHKHYSWKELLKAYGIYGCQCYADSPIADPSSTHPQFLVGGHMTTNPSGHVHYGGSCYLMPLCSWHNSTSRDGLPFSHSESRMLLLTGYMEGEAALTFRLRMPSSAPFALLFMKDGFWDYRDLSAAEAEELGTTKMLSSKEYFVLIERTQGEEALHRIKSHNLPV